MTNKKIFVFYKLSTRDQMPLVKIKAYRRYLFWVVALLN